MKWIFRPNDSYRVPDGTLLSPFLNPKDSKSGLPFDLLDGFSLAAGEIEAVTCSKIHVMPLVTQVTFVRRGTLQVKMKSDSEDEPYTLQLAPDQAVLTRPGTLFQLVNPGVESSEVLYVVSPPYLFETISGKILYDDSVVLEENWEQLAKAGWRLSKRLPTSEDRKEAERRLALRAMKSG